MAASFRSRILAVQIGVCFLACPMPINPIAAQDVANNSPEGKSSDSTAIRVVKLLWKSQPASAAATLERTLVASFDKSNTAELKSLLGGLADRFRETLESPEDPRFLVSLAALAVMDEPAVQARLVALVRAGTLAHDRRELLLRVWYKQSSDEVWNYAQGLLRESGTATSPVDEKWREIVLSRLLSCDNERATKIILQNWQGLPSATRIAMIEPMTQEAVTMHMLVSAIASGAVAKDLLNANQLLKWSSANDKELAAKIATVWGQLRSTDDAARKEVVQKTMQLLRSGKHGVPANGLLVFKRACAVCHKIHGEGLDVGPEITANGRGSFEQLVSNVLDPSLVIGEAFRAKNVLTSDGRVLTGIVSAQTEKTLTLKIQGGKLVELHIEEDIEELKDNPKSLMPDGLEQQMTEQELIDLFAFLALSKSLDATDNSTIPGTPSSLVPE